MKPPADKKLYRRLRLPNGMLVLLISDPAITKQSSTHSHGGQPQSMSEEDSGDEDCSESSDEVRAGSRAVPHCTCAKPADIAASCVMWGAQKLLSARRQQLWLTSSVPCCGVGQMD